MLPDASANFAASASETSPPAAAVSRIYNGHRRITTRKGQFEKTGGVWGAWVGMGQKERVQWYSVHQGYEVMQCS